MAEHGHGHSTAAWTTVGILLAATFLMSLAVVVTSWPLALVGVALAVAGLVAGKVMTMAGLGATKVDRSGDRTAAR